MLHPPQTTGLGEPRKSTVFFERSISTHWLFSNPPNPQRFRAWRHSPWSQFLFGIFILTFLNDTSSLRSRAHLRSCFYLTIPRTKRKVLSLTKPKGKTYKTKIPPQLYYNLTSYQYWVKVTKTRIKQWSTLNKRKIISKMKKNVNVAFENPIDE